MIKNKSPLRYPGGKTRACKPLDIILNEHFDITLFKNIVSPFLGGGSFEFHIQNKYKLKILANDKFTPLYNFWSVCKSNKKNLCEELYKKIGKIEKDDFKGLREEIMNENNKLNQSIMYFIINRCSFSGATLSGGFSLEASKKRFTKSSIKRIEKLNLDFVKFTNLDFTDFLMNFDNNEENIYFLDPPYYLTTKLYGNNGDMQEYFDHQRLQKILKSKNNWILCYNDCEYIRNLYKDYKIIDLDWKYGMNKSKKSSEIVIVKFD